MTRLRWGAAYLSQDGHQNDRMTQVGPHCRKVRTLGFRNRILRNRVIRFYYILLVSIQNRRGDICRSRADVRKENQHHISAPPVQDS